MMSTTQLAGAARQQSPARLSARGQNDDSDGEGSCSARNELLRVRDAMKVLDRTLIALLAERLRLAAQVGEAKRKLGLSIIDGVQKAAVVRRAAVAAREAGVEDEEIRSIFWRVIGLCRRGHMEELGQGTRSAAGGAP